MRAEKARMDATAINLANMHSSVPAGEMPFSPLRVVAEAVTMHFGSRFGELYAAERGGGVRLVAVTSRKTEPNMRHDPAHPHADAKGYVAYAGINHAAEMVNLNSAMRAYEANVIAMNAARTMATRALDIGGQ
jgi:flagellar basal-body rod protein FlgC